MPPGPQLMESMRAVGYSLKTAIADVVDNSITATATAIDIRFSAEPGNTFVSISDNGTGMDAAGVRHAMKLAGRNSTSARNAGDLGRFGLGLKTASLSQCRVLTLISKQDGVLVGVQWNLDHLAESGQWQLYVLSDDDLLGLSHTRYLDDKASGTVVLWEEIDVSDPDHARFTEDFTAKMADAKEHLALIYHRFLEGEDGQKISISLNLERIEPADPFLRNNRATQSGHKELIRVDGGEITFRPYTLPFINKMSAKERAQAQLNGPLRDNQGFYIYRAKRLVIWGTWFRLVSRSELGKLARVQVDIPNTLDHLWALDIKKSAASPPPAIRQALRQVIDRIIQPSERAFRHKGVIDDSRQSVMRTWLGLSSREGFYYQINREHPLLENLAEQLDSEQRLALDTALKAIESSFPVTDAYVKLTGDQPQKPPETTETALKDLATEYWRQWSAGGGSAEDFINGFKAAEQFSRCRDIHALLTEVTELGVMQ
ncbi:DNA mismatch repair enzyme (predicted ATPase) [Arthrobacter sp. 49Tsu3.1M3]|nr:DNA mismatch repair enzyme (predicted ATPase) [Arthrobacter sp. 49Tsu3.1M3]